MEKDILSILIIDPEATDHQRIRDSLERSKVPADLVFAISTDEGLKNIGKREFDLILTDHKLPEANAFQLLFDLQQRNLPTPVIVLTHESEARVARDAFQRGVDDYLLKEELETISMFDVISNVIEKKDLREEQIKRELLLREQAERDGLTGLYNHRYFIDAIEREFARARRYHRPLSLLMLDLDGFKSINDTCGHPQGDQLLRKIAQIIHQAVRFVDIVSRYGGDEFAVLLPETDLKPAGRLAGRLIDEIRKNPFLHEGKIFPVSASAGVAGYHPEQVTAGSLLKEADHALYEAKRKGRDRIVLSPTRQEVMRSSKSLQILHSQSPSVSH